MSDFLQALSNLPSDQEAIRAKCFHPTGKFVEFTKDAINQSIPERFETMARLHPHRLAVQSSDCALTYEALNQAAVEVYRKYFPQNCILVNRLSSTEAPAFRQYFIDHPTTITEDIVPAGYAV